MSGQLQYYQAQFEKFIEQPGVVNDALTYVQNKTQVKKAYIAYGTRLLFLLYVRYELRLGVQNCHYSMSDKFQ